MQQNGAGVDCPPSADALRTWFPDNVACRAYLERLRWPDGFVCPACGHRERRRTQAGRWSCRGCARVPSVTSGTIFHASRVPLPGWFTTAWHLAEHSRGVSARVVQKTLGLGSYQTAWLMLHRYRCAMGKDCADPLAGEIEVDAVTTAGLVRAEPPHDGVVAIAVEVPGLDEVGRVRLRHLPDPSPASLARFVRKTVAPTAVVLVGDAASGLDGHGRARGELDPATAVVHRVASQLIQWTCTTHGGVQPGHLQAYLDEFAFRFNQPRIRQDGHAFQRLLELGVNTAPVPYAQLTNGR